MVSLMIETVDTSILDSNDNAAGYKNSWSHFKD